jgi:hypothetical protein
MTFLYKDTGAAGSILCETTWTFYCPGAVIDHIRHRVRCMGFFAYGGWVVRKDQKPEGSVARIESFKYVPHNLGIKILDGPDLLF